MTDDSGLKCENTIRKGEERRPADEVKWRKGWRRSITCFSFHVLRASITALRSPFQTIMVDSESSPTAPSLEVIVGTYEQFLIGYRIQQDGVSCETIN